MHSETSHIAGAFSLDENIRRFRLLPIIFVKNSPTRISVSPFVAVAIKA